LKLTQELNLILIDEFQYGVEIGYKELQELILELLKIEKHLKNQVSNDENENKMLGRINYIRKEVDNIDFDKIQIEEIFIG